MPFFGAGRNTAYGPDSGPPPPTSQNPYGSGFGFGYTPQPYGYYPQLYQQYQHYYNTYSRPYSIAAPGGYVTNAVNPTQYPATNQAPAGNPVINPSIPAVNLTNSTGGVGCEPGYNYFFPAEHTKIHVFKTNDTPPWQLPVNFTAPFHACHVPTNTTIGQLLKGFGACNPNPELNKVIEVHQGGNGRWYKGMSFRGDDKDAMKQTIKEVGWDSSRNGLRGGKPVVHLYVVKG
ncbi:hypothetical protein J7T55_009928 [Diaporthe amygdali]|uniref:uncharacterized protein n=1 Tax=Phomopsis amygdali TaxID=1214568 RepID=UPI0022FE8FF6|nr:uncharacterized protein J7T55_009928 [Diaporthe amygdali]KAJ0116777.1 hypothetical protein J7T55_009928 [Diaporthe amygdali]